MKVKTKTSFSMEYTRLLGWIPVGERRVDIKTIKKHIKRMKRRGQLNDIWVTRETHTVCVRTYLRIFHMYTLV